MEKVVDEFLNREDALELIIYFGGGVWLIIALIMAYFKTKKEFGSFSILKFLHFIFDYTIGFALIIIEIFTKNKSGGNGSGSSSEKIIIKAKPIGRNIVEIYTKDGNGREGKFSRGCNELVNWNASSFTVKMFHGNKTQIHTYDSAGYETDTYWEQ